jgi:hypothetical protein
MPAIEPVTMMPRPISAKTARSTASHGITATKKRKSAAPSPWCPPAPLRAARAGYLHRDRRRQDRQPHHKPDTQHQRGNKPDRGDGERDIESLQCAKKIERKPGKDFKTRTASRRIFGTPARRAAPHRSS